MECKEFEFAILCQICCNHICDYHRKKVMYFSYKNAITLIKAKKKEEGGLGTNYIQ
jgi:hypothetical protein